MFNSSYEQRCFYTSITISPHSCLCVFYILFYYSLPRWYCVCEIHSQIALFSFLYLFVICVDEGLLSNSWFYIPSSCSQLYVYSGLCVCVPILLFSLLYWRYSVISIVVLYYCHYFLVWYYSLKEEEELVSYRSWVISSQCFFFLLQIFLDDSFVFVFLISYSLHNNITSHYFYYV